MTDGYELIERIQKRIAELPIGYISQKNIRGKTSYYRQWRENGKLKSKYIRADELESVRAQIEERKVLEEKLKELRKVYPEKTAEKAVYETNVVYGEALRQMVEPVKKLQKRDLFSKIEKYIYSDDRTHVCAVYGLRRTGKTTMLFQAIADMKAEDFAKAAYIKFKTSNAMRAAERDMQKLWEAGYRYVFLDEVTLLEDFIDTAAVFSDIYVAMGMKIVLSGTDSLGFWFAEGNELYDRVRMVHTTFIPYREYSRLLGIDSIDEYIRYGGTLRMGETNFDDEDAMAEDASFRDDESTRKYIDTAICKNIQHSLACYKDGYQFGHLYSLYEANELTNAINRIIEDMTHRFVKSVVDDNFKSHDLGQTAKNLRRERDPERRTDILDHIDKTAVTKELMRLLDIRNKEQRAIEITQSHIVLIKRFLKELDLIVDCPIEHGEVGVEREEHILFTQPGMRYCQAQALVYSLTKDLTYQMLTSDESEYIAERILEEVRGRMLEEIILLETTKALGKKYQVFKLQSLDGEYDMVIRNAKTNTCAIYEIKHSKECVYEQARHLRSEKMLSMTTPRFGTLVGRYVLYLGDELDTEEGIAYRSAEQFLKTLPDVKLAQ